MPPHHQVLAPFLPVAAAATLSELLLGDGLVSVAEFREAFKTVSVAVRRQVRDATGASLPSLGMARQTADEARLHAHFPVYDPRTPRIAAATVEDTDNADDVWSAGDFIKLTFDMPTDLAAARGDRAFVDRLFRIEPPIGADYSGEWRTDRLFRIQARGAPCALHAHCARALHAHWMQTA